MGEHRTAALRVRIIPRSPTGTIGETLGQDVDDSGGIPMVPENEAVVRRFMTELCSDGSLAVADEVVASDHVHRVGDEELHGPEELKRAVLGLRTAFPDLRFEIDDLISDGDQVVLRWTATGTHGGTFADVAPTGRRVTWIGCDWFRLRSGQLTEAFVVADGGALYEQLTSLEM
jgi:predicted ester cyclase